MDFKSKITLYNPRSISSSPVSYFYKSCIILPYTFEYIICFQLFIFYAFIYFAGAGI
jgi:hypothetical protein